MTARAWRLAPTLLALAAGIAFLVLEPRPGDLAAHTFRAELFGREGFTIWNGQWYGGHHTPAYSVLSPPLTWLVGPRLLLVMAAVACAGRYVALPSAKPDKSAYRERALIEGGLPYLKLRWRSEEWRVYEVTLPAPFVIPEGRANLTLEQLRPDELLLRLIRPGKALVRVRFTPYWLAHGGCVERSGKWTKVTVRRPGFLRLTTRFAPERIVSRGRRCHGRR